MTIGLFPFNLGDYLTVANPTFTGNLTGGGGNINVKGGKLQLGGSDADASNTNWNIVQDGKFLKFQHDVGAGMIESFSVSTNAFDMGGKKVTSVASPTTGTDAATKEYVDNQVSAGFSPKAPVMAASTANVDIAVALSALDGYTLAANDRILLKDQTTASENGVYQLNATKIPVKVGPDSVKGSSVFVENGSTQNDYIFSTSVTDSWIAFSKVDTINPGTGLEKVGTTLNIKASGVTNAMLAGSIGWDKLSNTANVETATWATATGATTAISLQTRISDILAAIKLSRGTVAYNTSNTQTIAGAYTAAGEKNRTYRGDTSSGIPSTGLVIGDLYFEGSSI